MKEPGLIFDGERADTYDQRFARLAPLKDTLHILTQVAFGELPERARVLVVGAGTGAELLYLAEHHPEWQFTAVEPSAPMLEQCRKKAEARKFSERIAFHNCYLQQLPETVEHHAATCFLVSHFILEEKERVQFFEGIRERLLPEGLFVNADLAYPREKCDKLLKLWLQTLAYSGQSPDLIEDYRENLERAVGLLPSCQVESLLLRAGFQPPQPIFQAGLMAAWLSKRA